MKARKGVSLLKVSRLQPEWDGERRVVVGGGPSKGWIWGGGVWKGYRGPRQPGPWPRQL